LKKLSAELFMNSDYEKRLEAHIGRALRGLPELTAPQSLASRVMEQIEARQRMPWYQRSWQTWPRPLQASSFALLFAVFAGLCFLGWELPHSSLFASGTHHVSAWFSWLGTLWNALTVLIGGIVLMLKHLSLGIIAAGLFSLALGYLLCIGLGTVYFRLASQGINSRYYETN
jgi:uncharacterized membrane protein